MYLNTHIKGIALLFCILLVNGCTRFDLDNYQFDELPPRSESQLRTMADTSLTLPRLAEWSKRQQVDSLIFFSEILKFFDEPSALFYAQRSYEIATEKNWSIPRGVSAYRLARIKGENVGYGEDIEDALVDARISRRLLEPYENPNWSFDINELFGFLFLHAKEIDSAQYYFERSLDQINQLNIHEREANERKAILFNNLASTYPLSDSLNRARYYHQSDSVYEMLGDRDSRASLWLDWGIFHQYHNSFDKADSLFNRCIDYGKRVNNRDLLALAYLEKGYSHNRQFILNGKEDNFSMALSNLKLALRYESVNLYRIFDVMGNLYQMSWAIDVDESHLDSAMLYYKRSMIEARKAGAVKTMKELGYNISSLYNFGGEKILGEKLEYFLNENYSGVVDTLTRHSKSAYQRINQVEQRDIQVNENAKRTNQLLFSLGVLFILAMIFIFSLQRQQNRRLKAEMQALRAQINPHFISNSLNAIESLVNLGNTKAASKYLVHFSRLSRQILTGSRSSTTNLSDELKTLKHFLALEQLRFRDKLTYGIIVDPEVDADAVVVPTMILQPYTENAIWHGIKPKAEGGHVQVTAHKEGKVLVCSVEDNGIGREHSRALKKASVMKHKSMGMKITEDRIKAMGKVKGAQVEIQDLKDAAGQAAGTKVIIRLPYKLKK